MQSNLTTICSGELNYPTSIILAFLHTISGMFSVGGNLFVLVAIFQTPSLHTTSNYFIASLAVADLSVGLIINPLWVTKSVLNIWENSHFLTMFTEFMSMQTLFTTTYSLAFVSYDRYLAVTSVFRYLHLMTIKRCVLSIALVWVLSFGFGAVRFAVINPLMLPYLWTVVAVICYTIPFTIIAYSYYFIFKEARRQRRQIEAVENSISTRETSETIRSETKNRKAAYTIGIVIGLYLLFAFPSMVITAIQLITSDNCLKVRIIRMWFWGALVSFASSACNPWVYAARITEYRQAFKSILSYICPFKFSIATRNNKIKCLTIPKAKDNEMG
ncbi:probable G-protein coupled receptor No9 [Actinia tenebrosa]|uniref:Probable G-protein coupled receptor No9 n=1 Tax=Actinia tenebrosa TaxID=6105 RepID=A0A6P8IPP1_ACTTE|nr:probable G-protein coupled receptor No9 [Actinia tenebrosa]